MTNERENRPNRIDRRTVLKSIGAAGVTLSATGVVQASRPGPSDPLVVTGTVDRPVGRGRREDARTAALETFADRGGDPAAVRSTTLATSVSDSPAVAYVHWIDENGVPASYTGFAGDRRTESASHRRASEFAERWGSSSSVAGDDASTSGDWNRIHDHYCDDGENPYGTVSQHSEWYQHEDNYATRVSTSQSPGTNDWDTDWYNDGTWIYQDWGKCELDDSSLADWDPSGGDCGSQSFGASLSASGPSIDWSYTQPDVCRSDETSLANDDMRLHYEYTSQSDDNSISYETGSECVTDGTSSCETLDLVQNDSHARFSSGWSTSDFYGCAVLFRNDHC